MTGASSPGARRATSSFEDHWRWAEALEVSRMHGDGAGAHAAIRIEELLVSGDLRGVKRWREIATRLDQL